jgi:hypothetical protein
MKIRLRQYQYCVWVSFAMQEEGLCSRFVEGFYPKPRVAIHQNSLGNPAVYSKRRLPSGFEPAFGGSLVECSATAPNFIRSFLWSDCVFAKVISGQVSISPTFYEQLLRQNPFAKKLQTQIVSTQKLCKELWYDCQFHLYFTSSFFITEFFAHLLCAYNLGL